MIFRYLWRIHGFRVAGFILLLFPSVAWSMLEVTVTEGLTGEIPIAITSFAWEGSDPPPEEDIAAIVRANLSRTGLFDVLASHRLPAPPRSPDDFLAESWSAAGAEYLVSGRMRPERDNIAIEFHVYDVLANEVLQGFRITIPDNSLRRGGHRVADEVYERIIGEPGGFSVRIAYVSVSGQGEDRQFTLEVADSDGANPQFLFRSRQSLMSPSWSPDRRQIAYVSFENRNSEIWIQTIETGERQRLAGFSGINSAPAFSPDGQWLAMTLSRDGHPNIYVMNLQSQELIQVTRTQAIDTEPAWSPDSQTLYFTSDRSGSPQIYRTGFPSGRTERLTFGASSAGNATVSPDGQVMVYVHGGAGGLRLARMDLSTREVTMLTEGRFDKSPSFSPNGNIILFASSDQSRGVLGSVSRNGRFQQRLVLRTGEVREPAWAD